MSDIQKNCPRCGKVKPEYADEFMSDAELHLYSLMNSGECSSGYINQLANSTIRTPVCNCRNESIEEQK